jgi:hypothetical protein
MYAFKGILNFPHQEVDGKWVSLIKHLAGESRLWKAWTDVGDNLFSNAVNFGFALCYLTLLTVKKTDVVVWQAYFLIALGLSIFDSFLAIHYSTDIPLIAILLVQLLFGFYGAIALTLFAGRLESQFIAPPKAVLFLLYFYASLQIVVLVVNEIYSNITQLGPIKNPDFWDQLLGYSNAGLFWAVFALKFILVVYVYWICRKGALLFYFYQMGRAEMRGLENTREEFLREIRNPSTAVFEASATAISKP